MSLIFDILVAGAFIIGISVNARRGLVKSILLVFGYIISIWLAGVIAGQFSERFYDKFLDRKLSEKIQTETEKLDSAKLIKDKLFDEKLSVEVDTEEVREVILKDGDMVENLAVLAISKKSGVDEKIVDKFFVKDMLYEAQDNKLLFLAVDNENVQQSVRILANENEEKRTEVLYREIIKPYALMATRWVMAFVIFMIISALVSFLVSKVNFVNKIPVAGFLNTVLGGVVGAGEGFVIVMVTALGVKVLVALLGFDEKIIDDTTLFKIFYNIYK